MSETGARFEQIGRAALAGRWQLASYELGELGEIFHEDLAGSRWQGNDRLPPLAHRFATEDLAALQAAIVAHDRAAFGQAVARASATCNACHRAAAKPYIEVSESPGTEVPVMRTRISVASAAR